MCQSIMKSVTISLLTIERCGTGQYAAPNANSASAHYPYCADLETNCDRQFARKRFATTQDLGGLIEITRGDDDPPHPFMVVRGHGFLIDLSRIFGELWDQNNVASCA
jgi:hypothetical protein